MATVTEIEPFLDKEQLAAEIGLPVKDRWLRYRRKEGMPFYRVAGKVRYRASEVVAWLTQRGYIERSQE